MLLMFLTTVLLIAVVKCQPEEPKSIRMPEVQQEKVISDDEAMTQALTQSKSIVEDSARILNVSETSESEWEVNLNESAIKLIKSGAKVRLHVDYCWYEGKLEDNRVIFKPDWHPGGRVSVGIWNEGKYLSSVLVEKNHDRFKTDEKTSLHFDDSSKGTNPHDGSESGRGGSEPDSNKTTEGDAKGDRGDGGGSFVGQSVDSLQQMWK